MPTKPKHRKPLASPDKVWIAPRPPNTSEPRPFKPGLGRSNRYLEFADIAMGAKEIAPPKKKTSSTVSQPGSNLNRKSNVTSIDSQKPLKRGFGAFRNPR